MRIVITGGAGFIGSQLGLYLMQKNHDVVFLDNLSFGYTENIFSNYHKNLKPQFINMDIRDKKIEEVFDKVDVIFHLAGISSLPECQNNPQEAYQVNVAGTAHILEVARRKNVKRIIFSSSSAVYENETTFPTKETADFQPTLFYSLSKKHAEEICYSYQQLYGMDIVILRFFNVYGPHMDFRRPNPPFVSYIIKCLLENKSPLLHANGKQSRDMIYVDDVLIMCEKVMTHEKATNQTFNVGFGKSSTIEDVYKYIIQAFGKEKKKATFRTADLLWDQYPKLFESNYPLQTRFIVKEVNKHTQASIEKAQRILAWNPQVDLKEGLKRTVQFAMKNI